MKRKFKYDFSIIMPIYNKEEFLPTSIDSILNQEYDLNKIQVVAINDGSKDNSLNILKEYELKYKNIEVIDQKNTGQSIARNNGIKKAKGKYILFLDPDDYLSSNVCSLIFNFFEKHYDEVDLVSYKIIQMYNNQPERNQHYRNKVLNATGIYDLTKGNNIYSCITTVNHCTKNEQKYFFDDMSFHEDQKFSRDVIKNKLKIGFVNEAVYYYVRHKDSITNSQKDFKKIHNSTVEMFENIFSTYNDKVPKYYQALLISDFSWKLKTNMLMPYFAGKEAFDQEFERLINLLNKVDEDVIICHIGLNEILKTFFISIKKDTNINIANGKKSISVLSNNNLLYVTNSVDLYLLNYRIEKNKIKIEGYLLEKVLAFLDNIDLYLVDLERPNIKKKIELRESSYSYFNSKEKTTKSWLFEVEIDYNEIRKFNFIVGINESVLSTVIIPTKFTPFNKSVIERNKVFRYSKQFAINYGNNTFIITNENKKEKRYHNKMLNTYYFLRDKKRWLARQVIKVFKFFIKENVWLYYDCKGVSKDNGTIQFKYDLQKKDGIKRYFVTANSWSVNRKVFSFRERRRLIKFNSIKHKLYFTIAKIRVTGYLEEVNSSAYSFQSYRSYSDLFNLPRLVYLQHGVLHASMPHKYSYDRFLIEREVISTHFEKENLIKNYSFSEKNLIESGMPRYDFTDHTKKPSKKILYAPSWRSYLVNDIKGTFYPNDEKFLNSKFYEETYNFFTSKELINMLEKYNYTLDFAFHPIFKMYEKYYQDIVSDRIKIGKTADDNSEYEVVITDFSSFVYDFVYLNRTIVYFFPDYDMFIAGANIYRKLDLPLEDAFGDLIMDSKSMNISLEKILKNNVAPDKKYIDRMNNFFLYYDNNQRERIYSNIIEMHREEENE